MHDNTQRAEKRIKEKYVLEALLENRREMETASAAEWERDELLIVCFGRLSCNICEMMRHKLFKLLLRV